jgi:hypothetical protein
MLRHPKITGSFRRGRRIVKRLRGGDAQHAQRYDPSRDEYPKLHQFHSLQIKTNHETSIVA